MVISYSSFPVPSGYPQNVRAELITSAKIFVIWDPVLEIERNGMIVRYGVQFNQSTLNEVSLSNFLVTEAPNLMLVLQEFVEYSIAVNSYNSVGAGPFSPAVTIQTLEDSEWGLC